MTKSPPEKKDMGENEKVRVAEILRQHKAALNLPGVKRITDKFEYETVTLVDGFSEVIITRPRLKTP